MQRPLNARRSVARSGSWLLGSPFPTPATWPPCCYGRSAALVYRGVGIPYVGRPHTTSGRRALHRARAILDHIIDRHDPDL